MSHHERGVESKEVLSEVYSGAVLSKGENFSDEVYPVGIEGVMRWWMGVKYSALVLAFSGIGGVVRWYPI